MSKNESLKDKLTNNYLSIKNYISYNILGKNRGSFRIPDNYQIKFIDDFKTFNKDRWMTTQYFGRIHPDFPKDYAADEAVKFTDVGLKLNTYFHNRKTLNYWDGKDYETVSDFGIITSVIPHEYGIFEWNVKLPKEKWQWPALWLTGFNSWPPEIDCIEGYSDLNGAYNSKLETNIHYKLDGFDTSIGARNTLKIKESKIHEYFNFKLLWEEDKIEMFINDFKVRSITNKKILNSFKDEKMHVVMNNKLRPDNHYSLPRSLKGTFIIKDFTYYVK